MIQSSPERAMICTVWMLGMVAIAPKVGRPSRHCCRRRLRGVGFAGVKMRISRVTCGVGLFGWRHIIRTKS